MRHAVLRLGRSLDDVPHALSWTDLHALLQVEVSTVGSPLDRALRPAQAAWTHEALLLRELQHAVQVLTWLTAGGTSSGTEYPERIPIEGDQPEVEGDAIDLDEYVKRYGGAPV